MVAERVVAVVGEHAILLSDMRQRARPFLFSTSHPPAVAAACLAAFQILEDEPERIEKRWDNTRYFKKGLQEALATGNAGARLRHLHLLAEALGHTGEVETGLGLLIEALEQIETVGQGDSLSEAHRLHGVLLLQQDVPDPARAEMCFQQALIIARDQQAKAWEIRAAVNLSRLWKQQGKRAQAYELLAPVYGWFTEGFDTADLQEARALLAVLA
jgi:predicted ATPase